MVAFGFGFGWLAACTPVETASGWFDCGDGFDCGLLAVDGAEVAVTRHLASVPIGRVAVAASGGPGSSSIGLVHSLVTGIDEPLWTDTTWIAMDNRGVGASDAVSCVGDDWFDDVRSRDPVPASDADAAALEASAATFRTGCLADRGEDGLATLGTTTYADDLDAFRAVLGVETLDFVGFSYGTWIGAVYAATYPEHVGRFALDGVVGPWTTRDEFLSRQVAGFDLALTRYFERCAADPECPVADPAGTYDALLAQAALAPLPAPTDPDGRVATVNELRWGVSSLLYGPDDDAFSAALAAAADGDAAGFLAAADDGWGRDPATGEYTKVYQGYWAIGCLDLPWPDGWTAEDLWALGASLDLDHPRIGSTILTGEANCLDWPVAVAPPSLAADPAPPLLLVVGRNDPATPYDDGIALQAALGNGSEVVTYEGDGHVAMFSDPTGCSYDVIRTFLAEGTIPTETCP
ncbi:MAG: alpha/beta fold hydrolase [Myxococcota bacterium]